jgi:hypothetical protein
MSKIVLDELEQVMFDKYTRESEQTMAVYLEVGVQGFRVSELCCKDDEIEFMRQMLAKALARLIREETNK